MDLIKLLINSLCMALGINPSVSRPFQRISDIVLNRVLELEYFLPDVPWWWFSFQKVFFRMVFAATPQKILFYS